MKEKVRIGLVGCGGISACHIEGAKMLVENGCNEFEITACCDVNRNSAEEKAAKITEFQKNKPVVFDDAEKMISSKVADGVILCLPHFLHHQLALSFLENGYHLMIEKPLAITLKAGEKIVDVAKERNCIVSVAENVRRYLPARAIKWAICQSEIVGKINFAVVQLVNYSPFDWNNPALKWRGIKLLSGGGMIFDSGHHFADMMMHLFGEVDEVWCEMKTFDTRIIENAPVVGTVKADVEDTWQAFIKFKNGTNINWVYSRTAVGADINYGLYIGEKGSFKEKGFVFHPFQSGGDFILKNGEVIESKEIEKEYLKTLSDEEKKNLFPYDCVDGFGVELFDFVRAIKNNCKPEIDGEEGINIMSLCLACYESSTAGKSVKFKDIIDKSINKYQEEINQFWGI